MKKINNFIDGKITSYSDSILPIYDPSKGEQISQVVNSNDQDFKNTIKSSKAGYKIWKEFTPLKRSRIIANFKNLIEDNIEELATLVSKEHGKTLEDAKGSVIRGLKLLSLLLNNSFIKRRILTECWNKH